MKVYRIGTTYIDLDHVLAVDEPYLSSSCYTAVKIPIILMFVGSKRITISIDQFLSTWPDGIKTEQQVSEWRIQENERENAHNQAELLRVKYNIWKPFLDAWENKDKEEAFSTITTHETPLSLHPYIW